LCASYVSVLTIMAAVHVPKTFVVNIEIYEVKKGHHWCRQSM
jgi:hypothetical protein